MDPGADLMLLHPDGSEEVLVPVQPQESIADPFVSFDGQWVFFAKMHDALNHKGADIYKVHVATRKVVRLTEQTSRRTPGAADWRSTPLPSWGVYNLGPCPVPGGKSPSSAIATASGRPTPATRHMPWPCSSSSWTTTAATSSGSAT